MRGVLIALVCLIGISCQTSEKQDPSDGWCAWHKTVNRLGSKTLTHGSRRILVDGRSPAQIRADFGKADEVRTEGFVELAYGQPREIPAFTEQWMYRRSMGHTLVFWNRGKVVLAVDEWSDY